MLRILLTTILFIPLIILAQSDTAISYSEVVESAAGKDQLFQRARQWYNETFSDSKQVLQIADKETGELSGQGFMLVPVKAKYWKSDNAFWQLAFTVNVWIKEGKYKYEFSNLLAYNDKIL